METQIAQAVEHWRLQPPSHRVAVFDGGFFDACTRAEAASGWGLPAPSVVEDIRRGTHNPKTTSFERKRLGAVAKAATDAGMTIAVAYFDFEGQYNIWSVDPETMQTVVADARVRENFEDALKIATPNGIAPPAPWTVANDPLAGSRWRAYGLGISRAGSEVSAATMRDVLGTTIGGTSTVVLNFNGCTPGAFATDDGNGWPNPDWDTTVDRSRTSCPCLYIKPTWQGLIDGLNRVRALSGNVIPIITACDWTPERAYYTDLLIAHLFRMGISDIMVHNPAGCGADGEKAIARSVLKYQAWISAERVSLPRITRDAPFIETNGLVTIKPIVRPQSE